LISHARSSRDTVTGDSIDRNRSNFFAVHVSRFADREVVDMSTIDIIEQTLVFDQPFITLYLQKRFDERRIAAKSLKISLLKPTKKRGIP
jgi:hypothetical protein